MHPRAVGRAHPRRLLAALCLVVALPAQALAVQVVTSSLPNATAGTSYFTSLVAGSGTTPYVWSLADGSLPAGMSLDPGAGSISGTATLAATSGFVVQVTDAVGDTASRPLTLTVGPAEPTVLAFAIQPSDVLAGSTMTPAVQVSVQDAFANPVPGAPVKLTLVGSGTLVGGGPIPSDVNGIATFFDIRVDTPGQKQLTASSGQVTPATSNPFTVSCPTITLAPSSLPAAAPGSPYSQTITASGGVFPYSFAVTSGAPPPGLTLATSGVLSGTPTTTGTFSFTVTATATGGCTGSGAYTIVVPAVPAAIGDLAATRVTSGNDADGTERIQITFTSPAFTTSLEVYRARFGGYPRYDDAGGLTPPTPSYPPGAPWVLTAVTASGQSDEPATRDAWSYVVFAKNALGQASGVSNQTPATPNYALGDVSNGFVAGTGDNLVNDLDISLLGAHYGISGAAILSAGVSYLDVGPTVDLSVNSRPFTDNRIDFEDLIVFATNYGVVSGPASLVAAADAAVRAATGPERILLAAPSHVEPGETFAAVVRIAAGGRIQGLSAEVGWDPAIAEPLATTSSGWVETQHGVLWSGAPGVLDAVLLGARARGLQGEGELGRVTFHALSAGDPRIALARVRARDAANRPLPDGTLSFGPDAAVARTALLDAGPNPARGPRTLGFALAQAGDVELAIFAADGRRVRTLAHGAFAAGSHSITWDGADESHRPASPGIYFAQLVTHGRRYTRTLVQLR